MTASDILAKYYDQRYCQLIGVDGELFKHEPGGNWVLVMEIRDAVVLEHERSHQDEDYKCLTNPA